MKKLHESMLPDVPQSFSLAMRTTLDAICEQEAKDMHPVKRPRALKWRTLVALVAAIALAASAALAAAIHYNVLDMLIGATPAGMQDIIVHDVAGARVGDVEVNVREAAYDGVTLYLLISARDTTATQCLGETFDQSGIRYIGENDQVPEAGRMWTDHFWIDGVDVGMPNLSSGQETGSDTPGELLYYTAYRLDQIDMFLTGEVRVTLPILAPPTEEERRALYDREAGVMRVPETGVLSFTLDCTSSEQTATTYPRIHTTVEQSIDVWTERAVFSPLFTYLNIGYSVPKEALDAYIAEHGPGYTDENGALLFPHTEMDVIAPWVFTDLWLVDKEGKPVCEREQGVFVYGSEGYGSEEAYFRFPALTDTAQEIYLAPLVDGVGDMKQAVRVN